MRDKYDAPHAEFYDDLWNEAEAQELRRLSDMITQTGNAVGYDVFFSRLLKHVVEAACNTSDVTGLIELMKHDNLFRDKTVYGSSRALMEISVLNPLRDDALIFCARINGDVKVAEFLIKQK